MRATHRGWITLTALTLSGLASADFPGPAPLAWRWQQPANVVPGQIAHTADTVFTAVGKRVYSLDLESGNQKWRFPVADPLSANLRMGVQLMGSTLVAAADDKVVYGLDAATGEQKWNYTVAQRLICPPVQSGDLVILAQSDSNIVAVNLNTGEAAWPNPIKVKDSIRGWVAASGNLLAVFDEGRNINVFDTATQRPVWQTRVAEMSANVQPTIVDDTIYFQAGTYALGLSLSGRGRLKFNVNVREFISQPLAVNQDYVAVTTDQGKVRAFNRSTGRETIRAGVSIEGNAVNAPTWVGNKIAVNTTSGSLMLVDPLVGEALWNYTLRPAFKIVLDDAAGGRGGAGGAGLSGAGGGGAAQSDNKPPTFMTASISPVNVGDTLFLAGRDGSLQAFNAKTGVDLTPPETKMLWPIPGSELNPTTTTNTRIDLFWQLDDQSSGIRADSVTVTTGGKTLEHTLTKDGVLYVRLSNAKNSLRDGRHVFKVTSSDWMGNKIEHEYVLVLDSTLPKTQAPNSTASQDGGRTAPGAGGSGGAGSSGRP